MQQEFQAKSGGLPKLAVNSGINRGWGVTGVWPHRRLLNKEFNHKVAEVAQSGRRFDKLFLFFFPSCYFVYLCG
jgi:hypothetical protein